MGLSGASLVAYVLVTQVLPLYVAAVVAVALARGVRRRLDGRRARVYRYAMAASDAVVTKRFARALFGVVLIAGTAWLAQHVSAPRSKDAWAIVTGTWLAAFVVYLLARRWPAAPTRPDRFAVIGLLVPSVGIALLLPITIHMPFALVMGAGTQVFDNWARMSLQLVGTTHIALAILVAIRAIQIAQGRKALSPVTIYVMTVAVSCVPGIMWFGLPPILVALTGLPFPILMKSMQHIADRERDAPSVPVAIAVRGVA